MSPTCEKCGDPLPLVARRHARFCSTRCRVAAHRAKKKPLPIELTGRTAWTRRDGKRPITANGRPASSTNRATWSTYKHMAAVSTGDGLGIMLGDGLGCFDLDHCLTGGRLKEWAADILDDLNPIYVERSMSGDGLHAFVHADEAPGWKRDGVEFYTRERFIAITGDTYTR